MHLRTLQYLCIWQLLRGIECLLLLHAELVLLQMVRGTQGVRQFLPNMTPPVTSTNARKVFGIEVDGDFSDVCEQRLGPWVGVQCAQEAPGLVLGEEGDVGEQFLLCDGPKS